MARNLNYLANIKQNFANLILKSEGLQINFLS